MTATASADAAIGQRIEDLDTPTLYVDLDALDHNILTETAPPFHRDQRLSRNGFFLRAGGHRYQQDDHDDVERCLHTGVTRAGPDRFPEARLRGRRQTSREVRLLLLRSGEEGAARVLDCFGGLVLTPTQRRQVVRRWVTAAVPAASSPQLPAPPDSVLLSKSVCHREQPGTVGREPSRRLGPAARPTLRAW